MLENSNKIIISNVEFNRTSYGGKPFSVTITSDNKEASDIFAGAWNGSNWLRFNNGVLESVNVYKQPIPIEDEQIVEFWPYSNEPTQGKLIFKDKKNHSTYDPSIYVSSIQGYTGGYKRKAQVLEECGFYCMRSKKRT